MLVFKIIATVTIMTLDNLDNAFDQAVMMYEPSLADRKRANEPEPEPVKEAPKILKVPKPKAVKKQKKVVDEYSKYDDEYDGFNYNR